MKQQLSSEFSFKLRYKLMHLKSKFTLIFWSRLRPNFAPNEICWEIKTKIRHQLIKCIYEKKENEL